MKKYLALALVALAIVTACLCLFSCSDDETSLETALAEIDKITFKDKTVVYTGKPKNLTVNTGLRYNRMPSGLKVRYEGNGNVEVGEYEVKAIFSRDGEDIPEATKTAKLTITKAASDLTDFIGDFKDTIVSYNGQVQTLKLDEDKLPEGVTVTYDYHDQEPKAAGTYKITAKFGHTDDYLKNYQPINDVDVTLTIERKIFDTSGLSFNKTYAVFDGSPVSVEVSGTLPEGLGVRYEGNGICSAGVHTIRAIFYTDDPNYEAPAPMVTELVIINENFTSDEGLSFKLKTDGTYSVSKYTGDATYLIIPDTYNGKSVTEIGNQVFAQKSFEYVYIPDTVTTLGSSVFKGCSGLKELHLSENLSTIGASAFTNCTALTTVSLPDKLTELPNSLFNGCTALQSVTLGSSVTTIGNTVFKGCVKLDKIYLPKTVTSVAATAKRNNQSPFFGTAANFMIVLENDAPGEKYSDYWNVRSEETVGETTVAKKALVLFSLTYDEFISNHEALRNANEETALVDKIFIGSIPLDGFDPQKTDYKTFANVANGYPTVKVDVASPAALLTVTQASAENGGKAIITVVSANGENRMTYTVTFERVGFFDPEAEIVNKNGADGVVTYVVDDGYEDTATFAKSMLGKYSNLAFSFAVWTRDLATLEEQTDTDGIKSYVMEDGKYKYTVNQEKVNFWSGILDEDNVNAGRVEMISHTHTHKPWGLNDDGGEYKYVDNNGNLLTMTVPKGSSSKEFYASKQIIGDLFPSLKNLTIIEPGIGVRTTDITINGELIPTYHTYFKKLLKESIENNVYLATRGTFIPDGSGNYDDKVITKETMTSIEKRMSLPGLAVKNYDEVSLWTDYIDAAINKGGWACFCIHEMDDTPSNQKWYIPTEKADQLFAYTQDKNVWVATFTDACLYYIEWSTAKVTSSYDIDSDRISVAVTDEAEGEMFNMALTVKVNVPVAWGDTVYAGAKALTVKTADDGSRYVYVDVVPDGNTVYLTPTVAE